MHPMSELPPLNKVVLLVTKTFNHSEPTLAFTEKLGDKLVWRSYDSENWTLNESVMIGWYEIPVDAYGRQ